MTILSILGLRLLKDLGTQSIRSLYLTEEQSAGKLELLCQGLVTRAGRTDSYGLSWLTLTAKGEAELHLRFAPERLAA